MVKAYVADRESGKTSSTVRQTFDIIKDNWKVMGINDAGTDYILMETILLFGISQEILCR